MKEAVRVKIEVALTAAIFLFALASLSLVGCRQPVTECPRVKELIEENRDRLGGYIAIGDAEIQLYASSMECLSCHPGAGNLDYSSLRPQAEFLRRQPVQAQGTFPPFSYDPDSIVYTQSATKFSLSFGVGFKAYFGEAEKIGIRASFKAMPTFYNTGASLWFGSSGGGVAVSGNAIWQWEVAGGLTVKFGT